MAPMGSLVWLGLGRPARYGEQKGIDESQQAPGVGVSWMGDVADVALSSSLWPLCHWSLSSFPEGLGEPWVLWELDLGSDHSQPGGCKDLQGRDVGSGEGLPSGGGLVLLFPSPLSPKGTGQARTPWCHPWAGLGTMSPIWSLPLGLGQKEA